MNKIIIFCLVLFLGTSCKKYLTEDVKSFVTSDDFYKTKVGYIGLVNSAYSSLRDIFEGDPYIFEAGTDECLAGRTIQPLTLYLYKDLSPSETDPSGGTYIQTFYQTCYKAIMICNAGLYYNDPVTLISASDLNKYQGELRALRAFVYFQLVQQFGGVPLVTKYSKEPIKGYDRNTAEEVYNFIINEFKAAESLVDDAAAGSLPTGRMNKRVIKHYLAKAFLTRGYETFGTASDFSTAALYADSAINAQKLTLTFESLFTPGNEKNAEILFAVQYDATSIVDPKNDGNRQNAFYASYQGGEGASYAYPYRTFGLNPSLYFYNLFTPDDTRYDATFMTYVYGTFSPATATGKYIGKYYDYYDQASSRATLKIAYFYPPQWVTADSITKWKAADPTNRSLTRISAYSTAWEPTGGSGDWSTPIVKKFDDPKSQFSNTGSSTRDIFLARLGDTYLIAAEAYFKSGSLQTAADRINVVRGRAARTGKNLNIASTDVTLDYILDERARELFGEYHRWCDLRRTGTLKSRTLLYNRDIKALFATGVDPFAGANGIDKILRPIPQAEIDANSSKNFPQNPAYH
jgi:starch-binding outer membrane protein, SusD/RagB family